MQLKYKLTNQKLVLGVYPNNPSKELNDKFNKKRTVYRIQALIDIPEVGIQAGDFGGFAMSSKNLDHTGSCWIHDDAAVMDEARVTDDAQMRGKSQARDFALVMDNSELRDKAYIGGTQRLDGNLVLENDVSLTRKLIFCKGPIHDILVSDNHITIGCQTRKIKDWPNDIDEVCRKHNYIGRGHEFYVDFINLIVRFRGLDKKES